MGFCEKEKIGHRREISIGKCGESGWHKLHEKTNTGKSPFCCQVCENGLRDNLYIKALIQKMRELIIIMCNEGDSHKFWI